MSEIELFVWLGENVERIGLVAVVMLSASLYLYGLHKEWHVPGSYHRRMVKAGDEALELLPEVQEKFTTLRITAAEQKVRDDYTQRELEEKERRLRQCEQDRDLCYERDAPRRGNRGRQ